MIRTAKSSGILHLLMVSLALAEQDLSHNGTHREYEVKRLEGGSKVSSHTIVLNCETGAPSTPNGISSLCTTVALFLGKPDGSPKGAREEVIDLFSTSPGLMDPLRLRTKWKWQLRPETESEALLKRIFTTPTHPPPTSAGKPLLAFEGEVVIYKGQWQGRDLRFDERREIATMRVLRAVQPSSNTILGARVTSSGRGQDFDRLGAAPANISIDGISEYRLKESPPKGTTLTADVDNAIERGRKWILEAQRADGSFSDSQPYPIGTQAQIGSTCLALYALLHAGVKPLDPRILKGHNYVYRTRSQQSYDHALLLTYLSARAISIADITQNQGEKAKPTLEILSQADRDLVHRSITYLLQCQDKDGGFGYSKAFEEPNFSSMQYCLLGLSAASQLGAKVPNSTWRRALTAIRNRAVFTTSDLSLSRQFTNGSSTQSRVTAVGWPYYSSNQSPSVWGNTPTTTMATAAITSLYLIRDELASLNDLDPKTEAECTSLIDGAWAWVALNYSITTSAPQGLWWGPSMHSYHTYSFERAGVLSQLKTLQGHDWHEEGTRHLLAIQEEQGYWADRKSTALVDTSMALLFLKRAVARRSVATESGRKD